MFPVALPSAVSWVARLFTAPPPPTRISRGLRNGEVLRLDHRPATQATLLVTRGTVWLTTTPADADTILHAGACVDIAGAWPVVAQAIGADAEVDVTHSPE